MVRSWLMSLLSILIVSSAFAVTDTDQPFVYEGEEVNKKDEQGRKQDKWVILGKMRALPEYKPEQKIEEGFYKNNRKNGLWIKYYPNANKKSEITYANGRPRGSYSTYYKEGQVEEQGNWNSNRNTGDFVRFYKDGSIEQQKKFNSAGKEDGKVEYFHDNGKPELVYTSEGGVKKGKAVWYYKNGDVKKEVEYKEDNVLEDQIKEFDRINPKFKDSGSSVKKEKVKAAPMASGTTNGAHEMLEDGYNKLYNENQDLHMDGEFKGGQLWNGKLYLYDKYGLLKTIEIYKEGEFFGNGVVE